MSKSIDEILAVTEDPAYRRVVTARISMVRQDLRDEHAELDALLPTLKSDTMDSHPKLKPTLDRIAEIEDEFKRNTIEFRFRCIGQRAWADLLAKHPPTRKQLESDRRLDHNPETFPFEAIAATCVEPEMTAQQARQLAESEALDVASWSAIWGSCLKANVTDADPKSQAAGLLRLLSGAFDERHTNSESPAPSSSDE